MRLSCHPAASNLTITSRLFIIRIMCVSMADFKGWIAGHAISSSAIASFYITQAVSIPSAAAGSTSIR